jgi:hypothetical protein
MLFAVGRQKEVHHIRCVRVIVARFGSSSFPSGDIEIRRPTVEEPDNRHRWLACPAGGHTAAVLPSSVMYSRFHSITWPARARKYSGTAVTIFRIACYALDGYRSKSRFGWRSNMKLLRLMVSTLMILAGANALAASQTCQDTNLKKQVVYYASKLTRGYYAKWNEPGFLG